VAKGIKTGGRSKGTPNKTTALLKDAILRAAEAAGGDNGMVGYLTMQAQENPGPFMALLGKVLPMQLTGAEGGPLELVTRIELVAPKDHGDRPA
jgi:hypothetical protein